MLTSCLQHPEHTHLSRICFPLHLTPPPFRKGKEQMKMKPVVLIPDWMVFYSACQLTQSLENGKLGGCSLPHIQPWVSTLRVLIGLLCPLSPLYHLPRQALSYSAGSFLFLVSLKQVVENTHPSVSTLHHSELVCTTLFSSHVLFSHHRVWRAGLNSASEVPCRSGGTEQHGFEKEAYTELLACLGEARIGNRRQFVSPFSPCGSAP